MRRGFLLNRDGLYAPYPTRNKKPTRDNRWLPVLDDARNLSPQPGCTTRELRMWARCPELSYEQKQKIRALGRSQNLVFHNIKVGSVEVSTLLDSTVVKLLRLHFAAPPTALSDAIEFRHARDKGVGVFARQNISTGAILHVEVPAVVTQTTFALNSGMTASEIYRELFQRVPEKTLPALLLLNDAHPGRYDVEEAILRSNALAVKMPTICLPSSAAMGHLGLFVKASRFNHSCSPNVIHRFDPESFALTIHSIRPINEGEELLRSYIDLNSLPTREQRRLMLRSLCNFDCACERCTLPSAAAIRESDLRRQKICQTKIETIEAPLIAWYLNNGRYDIQKVIDFHLAAVEDMRVEGLHPETYFQHLRMLAICFAAIEDTRRFRVWMGKARDVASANSDLDAAREMWEYIVEPDKYPEWGLAQRIRNRACSSCFITATTVQTSAVILKDLSQPVGS
ncbi:SET domain-containing protein [Favolaschia claudopus]|uniref:SET domain-containing protein n=1 Tax=Favolaschia claudopus TaxID=2862362 RepID=A0AAW0A9C5_9AGAR